MVGRDLQQLGGVAEAMDLVEDEALPPPRTQELLWIIHQPPRPRQLAVEVFDPVEALAQERLAGPPHAGEPQH